MPATPFQPDRQPTGTPAIVASRNLRWQWPGQQRPLVFPDLNLKAGDHLFLKGASGSGKSTLLSLLSGLLKPVTGELSVHDQLMNRLSGGTRDRLRADRTGVIFQQFNLVPYLSVIDNVTLPCRLSRHRRQALKVAPDAAAATLLEALHLPRNCWHRKATELSTGQQQRVAAARALIGAPPLILADEPTSALDTDNRDRFIDLLLGQASACGSSVIFVSHDPGLAHHFPNRVDLTLKPPVAAEETS